MAPIEDPKGRPKVPFDEIQTGDALGPFEYELTEQLVDRHLRATEQHRYPDPRLAPVSILAADGVQLADQFFDISQSVHAGQRVEVVRVPEKSFRKLRDGSSDLKQRVDELVDERRRNIVRSQEVRAWNQQDSWENSPEFRDQGLVQGQSLLLVDLDRCTRCGLCFVRCPDGAIALDEEGYPVIDYDHCKGCMICRQICPIHGIEVKRETEAW